MGSRKSLLVCSNFIPPYTSIISYLTCARTEVSGRSPGPEEGLTVPPVAVEDNGPPDSVPVEVPENVHLEALQGLLSYRDGAMIELLIVVLPKGYQR